MSHYIALRSGYCSPLPAAGMEIDAVVHDSAIEILQTPRMRTRM